MPAALLEKPHRTWDGYLGWNQTKAALMLGLNRDQIRYRIEKFKLERPATT